jgi:hypothetical protein
MSLQEDLRCELHARKPAVGLGPGSRTWKRGVNWSPENENTSSPIHLVQTLDGHSIIWDFNWIAPSNETDS